jgi:hypothetical protein
VVMQGTVPIPYEQPSEDGRKLEYLAPRLVMSM